MPTLTLPNGAKQSMKEVCDVIDVYRRNDPAVFDLYDLPECGPHDEVRPIDLLSLNAMNAWAGGQPMTWMTAAWTRREEIADAVKRVGKAPLEELNDAQAGEEAEKVGAALNVIDAIPGYGSTATAKLFHRLRPNLGPIWDKWVGEWYQESAKEDWGPWVKRVYDHVREPETRQCLLDCRKHIAIQLSLLRIWDVILWQLKGPGTRE